MDGFKTDGGEFICGPGARFHDGSSGREGVNCYARDYTRAYSPLFGPGPRSVQPGWLGWPAHRAHPLGRGSAVPKQRAEKAPSPPGSRPPSRASLLGFDIGGFAGPLPTLDLYRRATQLACFCPIMQWHSEPDGGQFRELMPGAQGNNERSPWNLAQANGAPEFVAEMRFWHLLRMQLLPLSLGHGTGVGPNGQAHDAPPWSTTGRRTLRAVACGDEYLLGDALLVAPLLKKTPKHGPSIHPAGRWDRLVDGRACQGGREVCRRRRQTPGFPAREL